ncbi:MAG: S24/S26 family peptidase, partial [Ktedonobacteraceae bacterium]
MSQSKLDLIASLFIQALREGQSLWFRVASNSMFPLLRKGDEVFIQPVQACEIRLGEIAAFETSSGLVIHRIISIQHTPA